MARCTADVIKEITTKHLSKGGLLLGQCVSAVGWIGGTVPDVPGIVELPMTDVAAAGFACGMALMGKRPIFVVRYQGFMWLNSSSLVNYAAKSKSIWGVPCPIFIRAIAMEGNGIGHTASSSLHSIFMHSPGMKVVAPMTPKEYEIIWNCFLNGNDPYYVSEHRKSFQITEETPTEYDSNSEITIFAISAARLNAIEAVRILRKKGARVSLVHVLWLKPFVVLQDDIRALNQSKLGLVIDSGYEIAGASRSIAYQLMHETKAKVYAMGLEDRVCGVSKENENITPSAEKIVKKVWDILYG